MNVDQCLYVRECTFKGHKILTKNPRGWAQKEGEPEADIDTSGEITQADGPAVVCQYRQPVSACVGDTL